MISVIEDSPLRIERRDENNNIVASIAIPGTDLAGLAARLTEIAGRHKAP